MSNLEDSLWAIFYENDAYTVSGNKIMGRQAAGNALLRAYANSSFNNLGVYARNKDAFNEFSTNFSKLLSNAKTKNIDYIPWGNPSNLSNYGGLYYPAPDISRFVNQRYFFNDNNYSIVGITHTTASESAINSLLECYTSPLKPWDAIICTSNAVKTSLDNLYDQYHATLNERLGATKKPNFEMPVIPLGVHLDDYQFSDSQRSHSRTKLGIKEDDIVVLFLGRLSFHAKAHYIPMYIALENVKKSLPKNVNLHLIQTGWFPNEAIENLYKDDAKNVCPSVFCHFLDGRNIDDKTLSYASSDIFISLVDNFQETFGLTPLEGMASGLPAIVSDWNGYKDTVRDSIDGYRVPTVTLDDGGGYDLALRHNLGIDTYDHYIGRASQTVSVNIKDCIDKITTLATNKDLRLEMASNAKKRASDFSWINILEMYHDLKIELDEKRNFSKKSKKTFLPPISIQDPHTFFSNYPTFKLSNDCIITPSDSNTIKLEEFYTYSSITYLDDIAPSIDILHEIYNLIYKTKNCLVHDIVTNLKYNKSVILKSILWLSKYGYVNIENSSND